VLVDGQPVLGAERSSDVTLEIVELKGVLLADGHDHTLLSVAT